jgi:hypothetical protein
LLEYIFINACQIYNNKVKMGIENKL